MKRFVCLTLLLVASCTAPTQATPDTQATVDAAVKATLAAESTATTVAPPTSITLPSATPTSTPIPTTTPTPTTTPLPTNTPLPTDTPIPPATQTAIAVEAARMAESTAIMATQTALAESATATRQAVAAAATATAEVQATKAAEMAQYKSIDWRELINYADRHAGDKVKINARVFNIVKGTNDFQVYIAGTYEAVYITTRDQFSNLYDNDVITVYGEVDTKGFKCFTNVNNAEVCQPYLIDAFFTGGRTGSINNNVAAGNAAAVTPVPQPSGAACPSAEVCITYPPSGLSVNRGQTVRFSGSATDSNFVRYQFLAGNGQSWGHIADFKTAVTNGKLMDFYTGSVPAGTYTIMLQVIDSTGNIKSDKAQIILTIQ